MAKREKKPDTLKQKKARHYVKIILGVYLVYTAYSIVKDMHAGVAADRPALFYAAAAVFLAVGGALAVTSFLAAMKISAEELQEGQDEGKRQEEEQKERTDGEAETGCLEKKDETE